MINIVIGAGFGDEGKGQTVYNIAKEGSPSYVVRFNGGQQAGHTVQLADGTRHVFSNFGCGTMLGIPTYWSKHCTVHLKGLYNEYITLAKKGYIPTLYIDPFALVTLPWDIVTNQKTSKETKHGTVGVGFGQTIQRTEDWYKVYARDLLDRRILSRKLTIISNHYYPNMDSSEFDVFFDELDWLLSNPNIHIERPRIRGDVIFEGAQGVLLDQDFGFFPFVTRSKCTPFNALQVIDELGIPGNIFVNYVTRAYHTRHGNGPFTDGEKYLYLKDNILETNVNNPYQGEFRKSILNIDLLKYALDCSTLETGKRVVNKLFITCADHHTDEDFNVVSDGIIYKTNKNELHSSLTDHLKNKS